MEKINNSELVSVLQRYCNVNVTFSDWPKTLLEELNHPSHPHRAKRFQSQLAHAILSQTISPEEYEKLTEEDLETSKEVEERLRELWQDLYGASDPSLAVQS
jgi:hypothetical protein